MAATSTPDDARSAAHDDGADGFTVMGPEDTQAPVEPDPGDDDAARST